MGKRLRLLKTDIARVYGEVTLGTCLRALANPSIRVAYFVRLSTSRTPIVHALARNFLLMTAGIDVGRGLQVGEGIYFPHPTNIVIGEGVVIGSNVTIYHGVTLGRLHSAYPSIGDNVVIFPQSLIIGSVVVPSNTKVSPCSLLRSDASPE